MSNWQQDLAQHIKNAHKIAVLGAGSILCGDDAAGMIVAGRLNERAGDNPRLISLEGSTAPENFIGVIREFHADLVIMVDAAHIDGEVGDIALVSADEIDGLSFCTHMLPFGVLFKYLEQEINCQTIVIGIKPGNTIFATEPCEIIKLVSDDVVDIILASI